jgi:putative membrane-bound dehydrogenase-like protein
MMRAGRMAWFAGLLLCSGAMLPADDESGFKPIFDGQSLTGWAPWSGDEKFWRVTDGAIVGESTAEMPCEHNTFLRWDQGELDDFELRLKFRISGSDAANSGIQFRGIQREDGHVIGYQADIDRAGNWVGCLYDEAQRGTLATRGMRVTLNPGEQESFIETVGDAAELFSHVDINDWNDYSIKCEGRTITLSINGHQTIQIIDNDDSGYDPAGLLALQLHSGPPMKIEFKEIRVKRLPLTDGRKKIVLVAGRPSHGYFSHEHNAGCLLLADKLNAAAREHGLPVVAAVYKNGWPSDPTAMDNADCVVSYCDGGGGHYLNDRLEDFDYLVNERHVGLVCIHYAVETTKGDCGDHFLKWMGGFFEPHWSVNPHWTAKFDDLPEHPITRGVAPFEVNDEWYYHMRFVEGMEGVTPILTDMPPRDTLNREDGPHSGNPFVRAAVMERMEPQHVAWAYERPDGRGRGFGFTGGHFHQNWQDDNFRKVVLNAIIWAAQGEVPEGGVPSATPTTEQMEANQDEPKPGDQQAAAPAPQLGKEQVKSAYSSDVITPQTPGHSVEIDVDITGAQGLWLVVTDGGNGFGCDWADWAVPRLVGAPVTGRITIGGRPVAGATASFRSQDGNTSDTDQTDADGQYALAVGEVMLTDMNWKAASSQFGEVQKGKNNSGGELRIAGKPVAFGIGTHANSVIEYALPKDHGFTRFRAIGGLDNGGTDQGGCGQGASVQFHVFTSRPSAQFLAANSGGGGGGGAPASHEAVDAVEQLDVHPDLTATVFASEPMMTNPASIDVDHLGRVWVCEAINYRAFANKDVIGDHIDIGDRILVLEDTDGDAVADKSTVFYQGHDIDSAHGILVLPTPDGKGLSALVSALDSVFFLIDENGDLQADTKQLLFTGIDGAQHDHGIHAFHFGPDGKLYFNFGNAGRRIKDKDGQPIIDRAGNEVNDSRKPYQEGMVFRCNLDGSEFETLGWNFRNNWEACVDSFGTVWQSDNDDDGNRGVRINYVMEFGNFGYRDEFTGAGWNEARTNLETEIPLRHWHLNDPGVVPNLLQTGAGAPTGICMYEGDLLPKGLRGAVIHCDAGPNICRAYVPTPSGAGYTAETVNILDGARNKWFRPSDVCVAPDGSLLVADWYDPGVGGHRMQDAAHGRVFRVAPTISLTARDSRAIYEAAPLDLSTPEGAVDALRSPSMSRRYLGWAALQAMGEKSVPALEALWQSDDPVMQARALGALVKLGLGQDATTQYLKAGLHSPSADIRCFAIRLVRQLHEVVDIDDLEGDFNLQDPSPAVRREMLIGLREALRESRDVELEEAWVALAQQYDGKDRWYLEALGIAADNQWDRLLPAFLATNPSFADKATRDIVWRSRAEITPQILAATITHPQTPEDEIPRYVRALDFQSDELKGEALLALAFGDVPGAETRAAFVHAEALSRLGGFNARENPQQWATLLATLDSTEGSPLYIRLVDKFNVEEHYARLLAVAQKSPDSQPAVEAVKVLFGKDQQPLLADALRAENEEVSAATLLALATSADGRAVKLLSDLAHDDSAPVERRRAALKAMGAIRQGAIELQQLAERGNCPDVLVETLKATLHTVQWQDLREYAASKFPLPPGKNSTPLPPIAQLAQQSGDATHGSVLFHSTATCATCHQVGSLGKNVGPNLSEIGKKLSKEALYESILFPSAAISHNFENWLVVDDDGNQVSGLLISDTDVAVEIKDPKGIVHTVPKGKIEVFKKQDISLMPADLSKTLTLEELIDVVEYMTTLKQAAN